MWNRADDQMILALIRHGETQANAQRRYLGKTDEGLSERGIQLLLSYKEQNRYPEADHLFVSPMKRCMETAEILYPALKPVIIPEWEEMDFGVFEYKNYEELKNDLRYQKWIDSGGATGFPGGESRVAFIRRCEDGFQKMCRILQQAERRNPKVPVRAGIVVHGGTIMALMSSCGGKGYFDYQTANGGGYLCRIDGWKEGAALGNDKETVSKIMVRIKETVEI